MDSRIRFFSLVIAVFCLGLSTAGLAKMVSGKLAAVDAQAGNVTLQVTDAVTGETSVVDFGVDGNTVFTGTASLEDLKKDDVLWIEAEQVPEGNWKASKVVKT